MPGRASYQPRVKHQFVAKMRDLGYLVEQQQEIISSIMGILVAHAEELTELRTALDEIAKRQPSSFFTKV
jgi:hypothetical protein